MMPMTTAVMLGETAMGTADRPSCPPYLTCGVASDFDGDTEHTLHACIRLSCQGTHYMPVFDYHVIPSTHYMPVFDYHVRG